MQGREVSLLIHLFQYAVHRKRLGCNPSLVVQYESDLLQSGVTVQLADFASVSPRRRLAENLSTCLV